MNTHVSDHGDWFAFEQKIKPWPVRELTHFILSSLFISLGMVAFLLYHAFVLAVTPVHWLLRACKREGILYANFQNPTGRYSHDYPVMWGLIPGRNMLRRR